MLSRRRDRGFFPGFLSTEKICSLKLKRKQEKFGETFGAYGDVVLEIKRINEDSRWHYDWLVLVAKECGWYLIMTNIYWKCN